MSDPYDEYPDLNCPIMGKFIENVVCFDICLVAEGTSPENEVPVGFVLTEELAQQCLSCPNHIE